MIKQFLANGKIRRLLWVAFLFAMMTSGWKTFILYDTSSIFVRVSIKSPVNGTAHLYYDVGQGFNSRYVSTSPVYGDNKFHDVKLKIPFFKKVHHLRFDPPSISEGEIIVNKVDMVDRYGNVLHDFNLSKFKPANQIKKFDLINGDIHFSIDEKVNDPQINFLLDHPMTFNRLQSFAVMLLYHVIPGFFILLLIFTLLIYIWSRGTDQIIILAILLSGLISYYDSQSVYLRLSMKSMLRGDTAELYYDKGYGLYGANVVKASVHEDNLFHEYKFKIPRNINSLRFDPSKKAGSVVIKKMEITDRFGNVLQSIKPNQLSPAWEIKTFEYLEDGLKVETTDTATDSQILIMFDEVWQSNIRSLLFAVTTTLIEWSVIFVLLIVSFFITKRYKGSIFRLIDGAFFQEKLPVVYLGCAFGLILSMVVVGSRTCHPDEWGHILSAGYYSDSWLPGAVDDPKVLKTVGGWGVSYLFRMDVVYWLAGKFSWLLSGLVYEDFLRVRLFNAILFLILGIIVAYRARSVPMLSLALVVSPQIWYTFSYFNGDAFAFFISILIAWQLMDPDSITSQYLNSANIRDNMSGGALFGILLGVMMLSKMNYYLYVAFILFIIAWRFIFEQEHINTKSDKNLLRMKKGIFIAGVALCIYLPPVIYDQYINDFNKREKILIVAEQYAVPEFKPSTLRNNISESQQTLNLRGKGVSLKELFLRNPEWRDFSLKSFFGLYGNMNLYSDEEYYQAVTYILYLFFLLVFFYMIYTFPVRDLVFILFVLIFAGLAVGQSVYNSWVNDYEPQGRYLFIIIPMLMIGLAKLPNSFRTRVIPLFSLLFFFLSTWSFIWTALKSIPKLSGC